MSCWFNKGCLSKALKDKKVLLTTMSNKENDEFMKKIYSVILLCIGNEVLCDVTKYDTIDKVMIEGRKLTYDEVSYKLIVFE